MKQQIEPRSEIKSQSIWNAPTLKTKSGKKTWHFLSKKQRGEIAPLPSKLKKLSFKEDKYRLGPYEGPLADLKEFAAMKGLMQLECGAIKYKTKAVA